MSNDESYEYKPDSHYYYVNKDFIIPPKTKSRAKYPLQIVNNYEPDEEVIFQHFGTKIQERMIFHAHDGYLEHELEALGLLDDYIKDNYEDEGKD